MKNNGFIYKHVVVLGVDGADAVEKGHKSKDQILLIVGGNTKAGLFHVYGVGVAVKRGHGGVSNRENKAVGGVDLQHRRAEGEALPKLGEDRGGKAGVRRGRDLAAEAEGTVLFYKKFGSEYHIDSFLPTCGVLSF